MAKNFRSLRRSKRIRKHNKKLQRVIECREDLPNCEVFASSCYRQLDETIDNIYLWTQDMKQLHFTIDYDIHYGPQLSTPLLSVDNHYTEIISVN